MTISPKTSDPVSTIVGVLIGKNDGNIHLAMLESSVKREELAQKTVRYAGMIPVELKKALKVNEKEYQKVMAETFQESKRLEGHCQLAQEVFMKLSRMYKKQWMKERKLKK